VLDLEDGWEEVADFALDWAIKNAAARSSAALADVLLPDAPADAEPSSSSLRDPAARGMADQMPERLEERPS
jgi:hypothetical protein